MEPIDAIAIGVPARDEEDRIAACLRSIIASALLIDVPVLTVVAADACADRTAEVAEEILAAAPSGAGGLVVRTAHGTAGAARAAAVETALWHLRDASVWVATTDADTVVDRTWLGTHLAWAGTGVDGVAGLVDVAWEPGSEGLAGLYRASIADGGVALGHAHVHGANLGIRGTRWAAIGGCGALAVGEDQDLWRRLLADGAQLLGVDDLHVTTSGRLEGRTPGGFAGYLGTLVTPVGER